MTCNIERPDPQDLFDRFKNQFQNTVLGGGEVIPESNEWYAVAVNYAMAEEFFAIADQAWKERDPRQACDENLLAMAALDGVYPRPAVAAQGYVKLSGTAGTALPYPLEFEVGGVTYQTALESTQVTEIDDNGEAVIRVVAVIPGAAGNVVSETGALTTAVPGVDTEVEVCGGTFCTGSDEESVSAFRSRYLRRLQYQPQATAQWIEDKILEWPCATRAVRRSGSCCNEGCGDNCGCSDCGGRNDYYVIFDRSFPNGKAPFHVLQEVEDWLFGSPQGYGLGQVPIGVCGRIMPYETVEFDVFIDLDGCTSSSQLQAIRAAVTDFFTTVEPSQPVASGSIAATVSRLLGGVDADVRFEAVDPSVIYGNGVPKTDGQVVYSQGGGCQLEPDCDYMIALRNINVTSAGGSQIGCS